MRHNDDISSSPIPRLARQSHDIDDFMALSLLNWISAPFESLGRFTPQVAHAVPV
jgi:hypothetical protein